MVTCGSAAAMALATAACIAGNDPVKMLRLPFTDGLVNRVIMLRGQRFAYDQAIRMAGAHVVEVGSRAELDAALSQPVAMIAVLGNVEASGKLSWSRWQSRAAFPSWWMRPPSSWSGPCPISRAAPISRSIAAANICGARRPAGSCWARRR
jgi:hypothetical protein